MPGNTPFGIRFRRRRVRRCGRTNLTVTAAKKAVTVTALNQSAYTGSTAPDLSSPEADKNYKVEGLVGADTLSGTVTLTYAQTPDMSKPGKTAINITGTLSNDNYEITYVPGTLTVFRSAFQRRRWFLL